MKRFLLFSLFAILATSCFETDFNFKTVVKPSGDIIRETRIDGRGGNLFRPPYGDHWKVETHETKGGQSILADTYYHVYAKGHFSGSHEMGSDYQYDTENQFLDISDEERRNFINLGIVEPFESNIYSKNFIQVVKHRGFLTSRFEYQEVFQNRAVIQLLLNDIKKEVIREQAVAIPARPIVFELPSELTDEEEKPASDSEGDTDSQESVLPDAPTKISIPKPTTVEGQLLSSRVVEAIARERMETDILTKFRFHSEVTLPGKIKSSNADSIVDNTAVWKFTMNDFKDGHSRYVLKVTSEMIEWSTIILLGVVLLVILFGFSFVKMSQPKKRSTKRRHQST